MTVPTDQSSTSDPVPARPVLSYATPQADGLPDWHGEAEHMIRLGKSPNDLRRYFDKTEHAVRYFVKSVRRRFSAAQAGNRCIACGAEANTFWVVCTWQVEARVRAFEFSVSQSTIRREVATCHAVCDRCARRWLVRPWMDRVLVVGHWARWAAWVAIGVLVVSVLSVPPFHMQMVDEVLWCIALAFVIQMIAAITWRWRVPGAVRRLMPRSGVRLLRADLRPQSAAGPPPAELKSS